MWWPVSQVDILGKQSTGKKGLERASMPTQPPEERIKNFGEVSLGYSPEIARREAARCLQCRHRPCVKGCPVGIDIPGFVRLIAEGDFAGAAAVIRQDNTLPAICGRVCPQEVQCESLCVLGRKGQPVAIGNLERFAADWERETRGGAAGRTVKVNGQKKGKVAVVGSGPASLTAAAELNRLGYQVTIFEALHTPGGVLAYGIPEFRLPKDILAHEFQQLERQGVELRTNVLIGSTLTVDDLFAQGFQAVFLGTGAGLPNLLGIPGEDLNGVYTANEFLTRVNLMRAYLYPQVDTPLYLGKRVVVIGGGNTAMDAARTAVRLGSKVMVVYRRSRENLPARREEVLHAEEEGVEFRFLASPIAIRGDEQGWVEAIQCVNMELGEPTENGRQGVKPIAGSEHWLPADSVIVAIGQGPNPIISRTTPGLETGLHGVLKVAPETFMTSREGVFAAGDIITGGATVIKAMGGGKKAAQAIDRYLRNKNSRLINQSMSEG